MGNRESTGQRGHAVMRGRRSFESMYFCDPSSAHIDQTTITRHLLGDWDELPDPRSETSRVPALNVYESGPSEPADKPFA